MKPSKIFLFLIPICGFILFTSFNIITEIPVPSNVAWTKTEYKINTGEKLEIITTGEITISTGLKCSPVGIANSTDSCVLKTANYGSIIAKIGENGQPFLVGERLNTKVTESGTIYLGINDINLLNNQGEFLSCITVTQ